MNDKKLNQLFAAARQENPPAVPADFAERVQRGLNPSATANAPVVVSFLDQLNRNFGRYAAVAAAMIVLCVAVEISQSFSQEPSIDDDVNQICSDWMLH
jgi:hypothetical protein